VSFSIITLFTPETADKLLDFGLGFAKIVGLDVTSWRTGDPTLAQFKFVAEKLAATDQTVANLARSAVLSVIRDAANAGEAGAIDWLKMRALEDFGVEAQEATFAASAGGTGVTLLNSGGGNYPIDEVGKLTFKSSINGKTYHNTTLGTLAPGPGTTVTLEFIADEEGSDSTVAVGEIDTMVTTLLGVSITASAAAVGLDEESPDSIYNRCVASLGALSPNGPKDAYNFVARSPALTGINSIARVITVDNEDGTVTVYIANATGSATGAEVTAVQAAIDKYATPIGPTVTVVSATGVSIVTVATVAYKGSLSDLDLQTAIASKRNAKLAALDIGGDALVSGSKGVARDLHYEAIRSVVGITSVSLGTPAADVILAANQVPVPGACTITVV
jgi:phage-related baseplate assembly protein